ncbi:hypothetical protein PROFUN_06620 [Planoprotostelium fungivorum]|uniref:DH domain-containing protein n=1 Tax=Planoprotostelium fungivorum TaxID=1890364 RepID=A0A2P6MSS5_9EUKA|nr:hypothetical protein PROFUN_06620 [Planoprotostelium fungivorum]
MRWHQAYVIYRQIVHKVLESNLVLDSAICHALIVNRASLILPVRGVDPSPQRVVPLNEPQSLHNFCKCERDQYLLTVTHLLEYLLFGSFRFPDQFEPVAGEEPIDRHVAVLEVIQEGPYYALLMASLWIHSRKAIRAYQRVVTGKFETIFHWINAGTGNFSSIQNGSFVLTKQLSREHLYLVHHTLYAVIESSNLSSTIWTSGGRMRGPTAFGFNKPKPKADVSGSQVKRFNITAEAIAKITDARFCDFIRTLRSVRLWVETVLDIKLNDDLYISLKSGVILCYLMLAIEEGSIPTTQENTKHEFKLKENITYFLGAVSDYGVPPFKLFHPADLWDNECMVTVVECLAELARVAEKKGFHVKMLAVNMEGDNADAAILKKYTPQEINKYKAQLTRVKEPPSAKARPKMSESILRRKLELITGGKGDISKLEKGFGRFQALFRGHMARKGYKKMIRDNAFRESVAKEILSTEEVYVNYLKLTIEVFIRPLREDLKNKKSILSQEQIQHIFSNMEMIYGFNHKLLEDIKPRVNNWGPSQSLGDTDYLKIYSGYVENFNHSLEVIHSLGKKKEWEKFILEAKETPGLNRLDLPSLLIMPVQRVPRYSMLLSTLLKHTEKSHPDHKHLTNVTERIAKVAEYLNENKRQAENRTTLMSIDSSIDYGKTTAKAASDRQRRYILHAYFNDMKGLPVTAYLFSDMVLIADTLAKPEVKKKSAGSFQDVPAFPQTKYRESALIKDCHFTASSDQAVEISVGGKKVYLTTKQHNDRLKFVQEFNKLKGSTNSASTTAPSVASPTVEETKNSEDVEADIKDMEKRLRDRKLKQQTMSNESSPVEDRRLPKGTASTDTIHVPSESDEMRSPGGSSDDASRVSALKKTATKTKRFTIGSVLGGFNKKEIQAKLEAHEKLAALSTKELEDKRKNIQSQLNEMNTIVAEEEAKVTERKNNKKDKRESVIGGSTEKENKQRLDFAQKMSKDLTSELSDVEAVLKTR